MCEPPDEWSVSEPNELRNHAAIVVRPVVSGVSANVLVEAGVKRISRVLKSLRSPRTLLLLDQAVSGAGNAVPLILAGWRLGADGLASLSLALLIATTAIGLQRALILEPTLSVIGGTERRWHHPGTAVGVSVLLSAGAGTVSGLTDPAHSFSTAAAVGGAVVFACLHDFARYRALHHGKTVRTLISDSVWFVTAIAAVAYLPADWVTLLLGWGAGAALGSALLLFRSAHLTHDGLLRETWRRGRYQVSEVGVATLLTVVPFFVASALGWDARVAALRLAQSAAGPLNTIHSTVALAMLLRSGSISQRDRNATVGLRNRVRRLIVVASVCYMLCVTTFFLMFPPQSDAVAVALPLALAVVSVSIVLTSSTSPNIVLLRTFGRQASVFWGRVVTVGIAVAGTTLAVLIAPSEIDPATGSMLLASVAGLGVWWFVFRQLLNAMDGDS